MEDLEFNQLPLTGWYPGHMLRAGRKMKESLKLVDMVVEILDARIPRSSRNPEFRTMLHGKPVYLLLNKADLANPKITDMWIEAIRKRGGLVRAIDANAGEGVEELKAHWRTAVFKERKRRGVTSELKRSVRIMISGIPNIGKSTLVNRLGEAKKAQVGPRPGVTRHNQWIQLDNEMELLDTPGVLWPKIKDKNHELSLALAGCIKDEIVGVELLADFLWYMLYSKKLKANWDLYNLDECPDNYTDLLYAIGKRRGKLLPGGKVDMDQAAKFFIKDFRDAKLGRFSFEVPPKDKTDDNSKQE